MTGAPGIPFAKGADPRRAHGTKGRSGRPSEDAREICRRQLRAAKADAAVARILSNADHPAFGSVFKTVMAYAYGAPKQMLDVDVALPALRIAVDE